MSARVDSQSLRRTRLAARAPRALAVLTLTILALAGLRSLIDGPTGQRQSVGRESSADLGAEAFAEAFARAYLTWSSASPQAHDRSVRGLISEGLEPSAGFTVPSTGLQRVIWATPVQDIPVSARRRLVTVAAMTDQGPYYLSVPVRRDSSGYLSVSGYPALVGPPVTSTAAPSTDEPEVSAPDLVAVIQRALGNYLERATANLKADLDGQSVVSLPPRPLRLQSIEAVTWLGPQRVAVELRAAAQGATWTLRYELGVVRRERWYVRSIQTNPTRRSP